MERWRHVSLLHVAAVLTASLQAALLLLSLIMICLAYTQLKRMHTHTLVHTSRLRQQLVTPQRLVTVCARVPLAGVFMANVTIKTRFNFAMANDKQPEQHANTLDTHTRTHTPAYTGRHTHTHVARYCHNMAYKHANIKQQPQRHRHRHRQWDKVMLRGECRDAARRVRP